MIAAVKTFLVENFSDYQASAHRINVLNASNVLSETTQLMFGKARDLQLVKKTWLTKLSGAVKPITAIIRCGPLDDHRNSSCLVACMEQKPGCSYYQGF